MIFNTVNHALPALCMGVMGRGLDTESRNGRTKELTMQQITITDPRSPYITVPGRNASLPAQIAETMWILAGRNDVEWLSHYLPRAKDFSDDGETWRGGYGPRIRNFGYNAYGEGYGTDQLAHVVSLLKEDPETRRAVIAIYDPAIDTEPGKDIPCNDFLHFLPREGKLHLNVFTRSNDLMWGWSGINQFEWSILLQIVAKQAGLKLGSVTFNISSLHLYERHWEKAKKIADPKDYPLWTIHDPEFQGASSIEGMDRLINHWFAIEEKIRNMPSYGLRKEICDFPDPLLGAWLQVLYDWHQPNSGIMDNLKGTKLYLAFLTSPSKPIVDPEPRTPAERNRVDDFTKFLANLHSEKHDAYGNSWKKRGELRGITANIDRKIDRLGVGGGGDTSADTAMDLLVYLIKYELWLEENVPEDGSVESLTEGESHKRHVAARLVDLSTEVSKPLSNTELVKTAIEIIKDDWEYLEPWITEKRVDRVRRVTAMLPRVFLLAFTLWLWEEATKEQWKAMNETRRWKGYEV